MDREAMRAQTRQILQQIFSLPEVERVTIKDVSIRSAADEEGLERGMDACWHDHLSDVDMNLWVRLHPRTRGYGCFYQRHVQRLGVCRREIFGVLFQPRDNTQTEGIRAVLYNGFRMDVRIHVTEDEAAPWVDAPAGEEISAEREKQDAFWFIAVQALGKLLRRDHLISAHLSHMLLMEGLVLQMIRRDEQYGTNFHRWGYGEELTYRSIELPAGSENLLMGDDACRSIAEDLLRAVLSYDELSWAMDPGYTKRSEAFLQLWKSWLNA